MKRKKHLRKDTASKIKSLVEEVCSVLLIICPLHTHTHTHTHTLSFKIYFLMSIFGPYKIVCYQSNGC